MNCNRGDRERVLLDILFRGVLLVFVMQNHE